MKKSGFAKGVIWTLSIGIVLVVILAAVGVVAYNGYTNAALEASYSRGNTETTIKIEKKDKLSSEIVSVDKIKLKKDDKNLYKENKAIKNEYSLKDVLDFSKEWIKTGEVKHNNKNYNIWAKTDNLSIGGKKRKVIGITEVDKDRLQKKEQYYIGYNYDGTIEFSKLLDVNKGNGSRWLITDYPAYDKGWSSERLYYDDKEKNYQSGGWKHRDGSKWLYGVYQPDDSKNNSKGKWLTWGTKIKFAASETGLPKKEQEKLFKTAKKNFKEALEVKKLLVNLEKKHYVQILEDGSRNYAKKENDEEKPLDLLEKIESERSLLAQEKKELEKEKAELKKLKEKLSEQNNQSISSDLIKTDEKYYALVIGNNDYEYLEKLDAAQKDAEVIADILEKNYGFEVNLLLNADYETSVDTLYEVTDKLQKNDNLLIYYAGHGELEKDENRGYWLPVDASYEKKSKWISNQRIVDRIKATKAKHVLLIADSCFSGTLMRSGTINNINEPIDEKYIKRLKNKKTRLVITSGGNEPVVDSDGGDHSLFALKLIETLKNSKNVINSQILFENIRRYVVSNADQTPERAQVHKAGHDGGDFLFFPKK